MSVREFGVSGAPSVSFVVPSMNEEGNLENVVSEIRTACASSGVALGAVEIVLVDDGSTDSTPHVMARLAAADPAIRVVTHPRNLGFGAAYKSGVCAARLDYVFMVPGENSVPADTIAAILRRAGGVDLVIPYPLNLGARPLLRRLLSRLFQAMTSHVAGHRIRYFNGPGLHRRAAVLSALPKTDGHAFQLEMLARLLGRGHGYEEIGIVIRNRPMGKSKALLPKNIARVLFTLMRLQFERLLPDRARGIRE